MRAKNAVKHMETVYSFSDRIKHDDILMCISLCVCVRLLVESFQHITVDYLQSVWYGSNTSYVNHLTYVSSLLIFMQFKCICCNRRMLRAKTISFFSPHFSIMFYHGFFSRRSHVLCFVWKNTSSVVAFNTKLNTIYYLGIVFFVDFLKSNIQTTKR